MKSLQNNYYVYIHFRPWNGEPCYVGKGVRNRWNEHEKLGANHYNKHFANIFAKAGGSIPKVKVRMGLTALEANQIEKVFIAAIGRAPYGPLVNLTAGGEGSVGYVPTIEHRLNLSLANKGQKRSDETKRKMSLAGKGKKLSDEHKRKLAIVVQSAQWKERQHKSHLGKLLSEETKKKMSLALRGRKLSEEHKAKIGAAHKGSKRTVEARKKMSAWQVGRKHSAEAKAKMSVTRLGKPWSEKRRSNFLLKNAFI